MEREISQSCSRQFLHLFVKYLQLLHTETNLTLAAYRALAALFGMCGYILAKYECGCYGMLVCDTNCYRILVEMNRINMREAWQGSALTQLPFELPDQCLPGWHNTRVRHERAFCNAFWQNQCASVQSQSQDTQVETPRG